MAGHVAAQTVADSDIYNGRTAARNEYGAFKLLHV